MHEKLRARRVCGEWFDVDADEALRAVEASVDARWTAPEAMPAPREMTPAGLKAARARLGLSAAKLAQALRPGEGGGRTVRRREAGDRPISGPVQVAVEMMLERARPAGE